jgi:hypothetical protein
MKLTTILSLTILFTSGALHASELTSPIDPYIDEKTILVVRIDADRLDVNAARQWWEQATQGAGPDSREMRSIVWANLQQAGELADGFRKAGGRTLFYVVCLSDSPGGQSFFLMPIENGADAKALERLLERMPASGMKSAQIDHAVVLCNENMLAALKQFKPAARPELAQALADAGDAPIRAAVIVSQDVRRVIEAFAGKMPPEMGGGPITVLTDGVRWVSLSIKLPPEPAVALHVQSKDADAARGFAGLIRLGLFASRMHAGGEGSQIGALLNPVIAPQVEGDKVQITIDSARMNELAQNALGPLMIARRKASLQVSMSNMRQLLLSCIMYSNEHKDAFPNSLEDAAKFADIPATILTNPRDPGRHILIYEAHDATAREIAVGFADGHTEAWHDDATLQRWLVVQATGFKIMP